MCVIAVKNVGTPMPTKDLLKSMWDTNSDGAGFMYALNGKVHIEKGYMKYKDFESAVSKLADKFAKKNLDVPMVFHFRITTHGGTSPQNTHPFPISSKVDHLKALDLTCELGVVHNGIISSVSSTDTTMSDTMIYIADILSPLAMLNKNFYATTSGQTLLENTIGWSKLAFLDKKGVITTIGDFKKGTKDTSGILFSNLNHEFTTPRIKSYYTPRMYDYGYSGFQTSTFKPIPVGTALTDYNDNILDLVDKENTYYVGKDGDIFIKKKGTINTFEPSDVHFGFATLDLNAKNVDRYILGTYKDLKETAVFGYLDTEKGWE